MRPYRDVLTQNILIREFDENVDPVELMWHRDAEDRLIEPVEETDWKFQSDNSLPMDIQGEIFIPKETWHRIIKGTGSVKIKITKT